MKSLKLLSYAYGALIGALILMLASDPTTASISIVSTLCLSGLTSLGLGIKYYNAD